MKKTNITLAIGFALLFLLTFCNDIEQTKPTSKGLDLGEMVTRSITGVVVDENNVAVENAQVYLNNEVATTNEYGFFHFLKTEVNEKHVFVKVSKEGYLMGSRSIMPTEGVNRVNIKLLPAIEVGSVDASSGGSVSFENVNISFNAGFVDANGSDYSGEVTVKANYIDPLSDQLGDEMPGSLRALSDNQETLLKTYGMIGVELTDDNGNSLQIKDGETAEVRVPIPSELASSAPAIIPLWHFDEDQGIWIEDGEAVKQGNEYIGQVAHFSFWNWDIKVESTQSYGRILLEDGSPLAYAQVKIISPNAGTGYGSTCSKGLFGGIMPANIPLVISVYHRSFTISDAHEITIPALSSDAEIGDLVLPASVIETPSKAEGNIVDCDGDNINNAVVFLNNTFCVETVDGHYSASVYEGRQYTLTPVVYKPYSKGDLITITGAATDQTVEDLIICNSGGSIDAEIESMTVSYEIGEYQFVIESGFEVNKTANDELYELKLGSAADGNTSDDYLILKLYGVTDMTYALVEENSTHSIDFATDMDKVREIIPTNILVTTTKLGTLPGEEGELTFSGVFQDFDKQNNRYMNREVKNGVITYKLK